MYKLILIISSLCGSLCCAEFPYHPTHEINLISGLQINPHPVTTSSPQAQSYFNQGLNLLYGFNYDAAYWSFQKAVALDQNFAMGYWGMALALGSNVNSDITKKSERIAYGHIRQALELLDNITQSEKEYIQALAKRYTDNPNPDFKKLNTDYRDAMQILKNRYPDDPDASVLYVDSALDVSPWKQWTINGDPEPGTMELVETLQAILKASPYHLGANHYYIHTIEASKHPEYALESANRLRKIAPSLGHILHMPSHIYLLVGDYHQASIVNEAAITADLNYIREYGMDGNYALHYMSHNYYFLTRALGMQGKYKSALRAANDLQAFYLPHYEEMKDLEYYLSGKLFVYLRFHKWSEILEMEMPKPSSGVKLPITEALWHFGRSIAYAATGDLDKAIKEQSIFLEIKNSVPSNALFGFNSASTVLNIADSVLNAKIAGLQKNPGKEIDFLKEAVKIEDTLSYNEPPDWYFPVREALGAAYLRSNQYKDAEIVFREDLKIHPRNGRSLFGLLLSLKGQGRNSDAYFVQREVDEAWSYSDEPLSLSDL